MQRIGVLALQGSFSEHIAILERLGVEPPAVKLPKDLVGLDGLIIPGGESTTIGKLATTYRLKDVLRRLGEDGLPIWGTCAGMILLAREIEGAIQPHLGLMDIAVERNAFGRQVESFEADLAIPVLESVSSEEEKGKPFRAVFIRAPSIKRVGEGVEVLAALDDGVIAAARQRNLLATAFHPELTEDTRFHRYFLKMVESGYKGMAT
ncbi:MAG: pyridoxal 5'-phosphate synthase glutaminase subunit PdxT [Anaerolineae bacterium]|nr:pyridoxal 5'-phosphate synthase glutaminase subunit PdxT [Anaerolineae bacterium]